MKNSFLLTCAIALFTTTFGQTIENGTYIASKGLLFPSYAILTVDEDTATLEVFTRWQGVWLTAIDERDQTYQAQKAIKSTNGTYSNEKVYIQQKKQLKGKVKTTILGNKRFRFTKVDVLPENYLEVQHEAHEFNKR